MMLHAAAEGVAPSRRAPRAAQLCALPSVALLQRCTRSHQQQQQHAVAAPVVSQLQPFSYGPARRCTCASHAAEAAPGPQPPVSQRWGPQQVDTDWVVVNFYHLVNIPEPKLLVEEHRQWLQDKGFDVRGRIYISSQGVNCQFGGRKEEAMAYTQLFQSNPLFEGLRYSVWPADGPMYPKLRLKQRPNLISLAGGMEKMPITDPSSRATPLAPSDWKDMIAQAEKRNIVVLDVRNAYEWDAGHFAHAERPAEEVFNETPVGESEESVPAYLKDVDPETPVMMYCTGGIRCDVYSTFLRSKGFKNLYTLEGGIQNYLHEQGAQHWDGSLYVFDGRMAIAPNGSSAPTDLKAAVPCQMCGSPDAKLPHMNCANIDCNELFIACEACKLKYRGCCCAECTNAPRMLRPIKLDGGHYSNWGNYVERDEGGKVEGQALAAAQAAIAAGRSRAARQARRARRREVVQARREAQLAERHARKALMKQAMALAAAEEGQPQQAQQAPQVQHQQQQQQQQPATAA